MGSSPWFSQEIWAKTPKTPEKRGFLGRNFQKSGFGSEFSENSWISRVSELFRGRFVAWSLRDQAAAPTFEPFGLKSTEWRLVKLPAWFLRNQPPFRTFKVRKGGWWEQVEPATHPSLSGSGGSGVFDPRACLPFQGRQGGWFDLASSFARSAGESGFLILSRDGPSARRFCFAKTYRVTVVATVFFLRKNTGSNGPSGRFEKFKFL